MKRLLLTLLPIFLAIVVFVVFLFIMQQNSLGRGALQVTSKPQAKVYINNKEIGMTPLCKCDPNDILATGTYTIRLVAVNANVDPYEEKITINPSVLTVVDRTFGDVGKSSGSVITLSPIQNQNDAELFIASFPYGADVTIDSNSVGQTPVSQSITDSDHEVTLTKSGYKGKTVRIHGILGYKLNAVVTLATDDLSSLQASSSASGVSATASSSAGIIGTQVVILDTPTGFLRVRDSASLVGTEIGQVHPGETYPFIGEQPNWYQIKLSNGKLGWINSAYAKKED